MAYKNPFSFIVDLMKMDIPELLLINTPRENDPDLQHLFSNMLCKFIQRNVLNEVILCQFEDIMVINYVYETNQLTCNNSTYSDLNSIC